MLSVPSVVNLFLAARMKMEPGTSGGRIFATIKAMDVERTMQFILEQQA